MEQNELDEILKTNDFVIFGAQKNDVVMPYITYEKNNNILRFTTDSPGFKMNKQIEVVMENLFAKFGINNYKILIHKHQGDWHNKDVIIELNDNLNASDIIKFIQDTIFEVPIWHFKTS